MLDIDILRQDIDILRPDINILRQDINILRLDINILRPDINILYILRIFIAFGVNMHKSELLHWHNGNTEMN